MRGRTALMLFAGVAAAATAVAVYMGALSGACDGSIIASSSSPDGQHRAVLFERDCGATSASTSQVSIVANGEALGSSAANAFVADSNHQALRATAWGGPDTRLSWIAPATLEIHYDRGARVFLHETPVKGIAIRYVPDL